MKAKRNSMIATAALLAGVGSVAATAAVAQEKKSPPPAAVQNALEITRERVQADRKAIVARYLDLTAEEAEKFWPVYDAYQKDLEVANKRQMEALTRYARNYGSMSDADAKTLLEDILNNQKNLLDRKRTFVGRFGMVLPAKKVLRLYQVENRMDAAVEYELTGNLPLARTEPIRTGAKP